MSRKRLFPCAVLILTAALAPATAQDEASTLIPTPVSRYDSSVPEWVPQPELRSIDPFAESAAANPWEPTVLTAGITELLDPLVKQGVKLEETETGLRLSGPAELRSQARAQIDRITRWVRGRSVLSVAILELPGAEALDAAAVAAGVRFGSLDVLWPLRLTCERGQVVRREAVTSRNFISHLEFEVAMDAWVTDPQPLQFVTGRRLSAICRPTSVSTAEVVLSLHLSRPTTPMRRVTVNAGTIDLPEAQFVSLQAPLSLTVGTPQLIRVPSPFHAGSVAALITLESIDVPPQNATRLVDLSALAGHGPLGRAAPRTGFVSDRIDEDEEDSTPVDSAGSLRQQDLLQRLNAVDADLVELTPALFAIRAPSTAAIRILDKAAVTSTVLVRERRWVAWNDLLANPSFDPLRMGLLAGQTDPATLGGSPTVGGFQLPVARQTATRLRVGTYRRVITDFDAEIAQGSAGTQAVVKSHVSGESLAFIAVASPTAASPTVASPTVASPTAASLIVKVRRNRLRIIETRVQPLTVIADKGKGDAPQSHDQVDVIVAAETAAQFRVLNTQLVDVQRLADKAIIDAWFQR